jgi:hypothetical protein
MGEHIRNSDKILDEQKHPESLFLGLSHTQISTMGNMQRMIKIFIDMHDWIVITRTKHMHKAIKCDKVQHMVPILH